MTAQACIGSCWQSHVMSLGTERYWLEKGGTHVMPKHLALLADCAEMCQRTANSLLGGHRSMPPSVLHVPNFVMRAQKNARQ